MGKNENWTISYLYIFFKFISIFGVADGLLCKKIGDGVDAPPFIFGIMTILKQFHPNQTERYLQFLGQFVRSYFGPSFSW